MDYRQFLEKIMKSDETIRFALVFDMNGAVIEKAQRPGVKNHLNEYDTEKLLRESASSWHYRKQLSYKMGKGLYALAEYETFKRITLPLDGNHLLLVTADRQDDQPDILQNIQTVLEKENQGSYL